MNLTKFICVV
jgi:citrate synthase